VVAISLLLRQPAQREHGPRLAANPAPILTVLSKLESAADLFQIPFHFECGERALGGDAIETHRSFDDQDRDDRGMSWHRVPSGAARYHSCDRESRSSDVHGVYRRGAADTATRHTPPTPPP